VRLVLQQSQDFGELGRDAPTKLAVALSRKMELVLALPALGLNFIVRKQPSRIDERVRATLRRDALVQAREFVASLVPVISIRLLQLRIRHGDGLDTSGVGHGMERPDILDAHVIAARSDHHKVGVRHCKSCPQVSSHF
jgi:hypothetical protein